MVELVNSELERIKKIDRGLIDVLSQHLLGGAKENREKPVKILVWAKSPTEHVSNTSLQRHRYTSLLHITRNKLNLKKFGIAVLYLVTTKQNNHCSVSIGALDGGY
jgi:hypothetical protein